METRSQAYWKSEYQEFKNWIVDSPANRSYKDFAKTQFHKARRQYDKELIDNILEERNKFEEYLINSIWNEESDELYDQLFVGNQVVSKSHKEHNHKFKIKNIV